MKSSKAKPSTVGEYIKRSPVEARPRLREMRACIRKAAPGATESLKWGMPSFSSGKILLCYAAFKEHIGFFPTSSPMKRFAKQLKGYKTGKGSIQFPLEKKLPLALIRSITAFRLREVEKAGGRWKSKK